MGCGTSPDYEHWKKMAVLKAWELASLMQGYDPRALEDAVVRDPADPSSPHGVAPDFGSEIRLINSAACAGLIRSPDPVNDLELADTKILTATLGDWLVQVRHVHLASALGLTPSASTATCSTHIKSAALATVAELVAAFGAFTGMNRDWFKNLKDKPALKRARKHLGRGQRGHTMEPLFCPYEVMNWLITSKRRSGRALRKEKGWELLEKHFPSAYSAFSIGDPRQ